MRKSSTEVACVWVAGERMMPSLGTFNTGDKLTLPAEQAAEFIAAGLVQEAREPNPATKE